MAMNAEGRTVIAKVVMEAPSLTRWMDQDGSECAESMQTEVAMMSISDEQLQAWESLTQAAKPGPWTAKVDADLGLGTLPMLSRTEYDSAGGGFYSGYRIPDARFVAESRTAMSLLLAEVRRLRAGIARYRTILGEAIDDAAGLYESLAECFPGEGDGDA